MSTRQASAVRKKSVARKGISIIGAGTDLGIQNCYGSSQAPSKVISYLMDNGWGKHIAHVDMLMPPLYRYKDNLHKETDRMKSIKTLNRDIGFHVRDTIKNDRKFLCIGGDHSIAAGTWSQLPEITGLLWFDAHLDAHTEMTSESGNIHGMPLASLLGFGELGDNQISIQANNVAHVGARSYEIAEHILLSEECPITMFDMKSIEQRGLERVITSAIVQASNGYTIPFGISLDLDMFKPSQISQVNTPVEGGVDVDEWCQVMRNLKDEGLLDKLIGVEIVEYNPTIVQSTRKEYLDNVFNTCMEMLIDVE